MKDRDNIRLIKSIAFFKFFAHLILIEFDYFTRKSSF